MTPTQDTKSDRNWGTERPAPTTAMILHPVLPPAREGVAIATRPPDAALAEAAGLAAAITLDVADARCVRVNRPVAATLLGGGQVSDLGAVIDEAGIELVVMDASLTPIQQRNLERAWKVKVIDRTGLILEIFGERARTREGQLQVELAHLTYQRSRLVRSWTHLERQRGGAGFLGGPGESQIELDRRIIDDRIVHLNRQLEEVRRTRGIHRSARERVPYPVVALVGYTNAGTSTRFNRLTRSDVMAEDLLFATLDPTMRSIDLPFGTKAILSDTVGFISDLPTHLVAAFRATLEEVQGADLILHIRDISHPETEAQRADVLAVLRSLDIDVDDPALVREVWNKADRLSPDRRASLSTAGDALLVSASTGEGIEALRRSVTEQLNRDRRTVTLRVPLADGAVLAWLYSHGKVLDRCDGEEASDVTVSLAPIDLGRLAKQHPGLLSAPPS